MTPIIIQQDTIEFYELEAREFFKTILNTDYSAVIATDISSLSDFMGRGMDEDSDEWGEFNRLINSEERDSYEKLLDFWDEFILGKIKDKYGIELDSTNALLIDIFRRIDAQKKVSYKH